MNFCVCTDSVVKHGFTFTPAISLSIECQSEEEIRPLSSALSERVVGVTNLERIKRGLSPGRRGSREEALVSWDRWFAHYVRGARRPAGTAP